MRSTSLIAIVTVALVLLPHRASAQECYSRDRRDTAVVVSNPLITVETPNGQEVRVHWRTTANAPARTIVVQPGFPSQAAICPGRRNMDLALSFDAPPFTRPGISFVWWQADGRARVPIGGSQDPAVRAYIASTLAFPALARRDLAPPNYPDNIRPRSVLDYEVLKGDTVRIGVTVRVTDGKEEALVVVSWVFDRPGTTVAAAPPPRPADPCSADGSSALARPDSPGLRSVGATVTSGGAARVDRPRQTFRERLVTALGCYEAGALLRAFYHGTLTSGVDDVLAERLLPVVMPRGKTAADQHAQLVAIHERLLASADASKVVRELFAERAPTDAPLTKLEGELVAASFRASTWSDALRRMDRHLSTGTADGPAEARTEATLFLLSRRGEWTNVKIVQTLAAFAPPLIGAAVGLGAPLYEDLPATNSVQRPMDEAAPAMVDYMLDKASQTLGLLAHLGTPAVDAVARSMGRIRAGVRIGTARGTPLDVLSQSLAALPQDDAIKLARSALGDLTKTYARLSLIVGEPDRLVGNARFEMAVRLFANRTASVPSIQGWIGAAGNEVKRTTREMNARRDTVRALHVGVEARFNRSYERMLDACTPNLDCFSAFADYKVRVEQQQHHLAQLLDERAANLIEQRALCWRLTQRGGSNPVCPASRR